MKNDNELKFDKITERYFEFNNALFEFHKLFNEEKKDERAISIIGGTFSEMALEHVLRSFFPEDDKEVDKLFEFNQPLGNFSSKITMAYCLGLIDKLIKRDLDLVRKIRNKFAHDLYTSFQDQQIKSWCNELKFHEISMMMKAPPEANELEIFQVGVNQIISHLSGLISSSKKEKRKIIDDLKQFL
jgi:DNA-binding MltR family transcriptional regulator